jgi:hypothetical protein
MLKSMLAFCLLPQLCGLAAQPVVTKKQPDVKTEAVEMPAAPLGTESGAQYLAQIDQGRVLLRACSAKVEECDASRVGPDALVDSQGGTKFEARWYWLRAALADARKAKPEDRTALVQKAAERLDNESSALGQPAAGANVGEARTTVDAILARKEFRKVVENSYLGQKIQALILLLDRVFSKAGDLLPHSAWFGTALGWGVLALAAMGLLLWVWRSSQQQRVLMTVERLPVEKWQQESEQWAERAQAEAAARNWREAVHCLYWSAIVMLEGQRMWRQNRTRTPREYVVLLEPGSAKRRTLGGLTGVFERIWYGLRPAAEQDYQRARSLLDDLRAG